MRSAFITQELNKEGIQVINAMILGNPTPIYVDDYLPFRGTSKTSLYFAGVADDKSLWMAFMEKVWAKASGNYEIIEGGWSSESLRFLLGSPTRSFGRGSGDWASAQSIYDFITNQDVQK
jgi:hypothetical protein